MTTVTITTVTITTVNITTVTITTVIITVSLGSLFARKESTSSTGDLLFTLG